MFWHVTVNHPLDYLGQVLYGHDNTPYVVTQDMQCNFVVASGEEVQLMTRNVHEVCYFLNVHSARTMMNAPRLAGTRLA